MSSSNQNVTKGLLCQRKCRNRTGTNRGSNVERLNIASFYGMRKRRKVGPFRIPQNFSSIYTSSWLKSPKLFLNLNRGVQFCIWKLFVHVISRKNRLFGREDKWQELVGCKILYFTPNSEHELTKNMLLCRLEISLTYQLSPNITCHAMKYYLNSLMPVRRLDSWVVFTLNYNEHR